MSTPEHFVYRGIHCGGPKKGTLSLSDVDTVVRLLEDHCIPLQHVMLVVDWSPQQIWDATRGVG